VLSLGDRYGLAPGRPASFLLLDAADGFDVVRRQVRPRTVVANGRVVAEGPATGSTLRWPGRAPETVDFTRPADRG
jgi:cytosine deaminase